MYERLAGHDPLFVAEVLARVRSAERLLGNSDSRSQETRGRLTMPDTVLDKMERALYGGQGTLDVDMLASAVCDLAREIDKLREELRNA